MRTQHHRTNLRCGACLETIRPVFDREVGPGLWEVDLSAPDKVLTVHSDTVSPARVAELLQQVGYQSLGELTIPPPPATTDDKPITYYPLLLLLLFLLGGTALLQTRLERPDAMRAMMDFMGLFFVAFAFFKLLDLPGFAATYQGYDLIAQTLPVWGYLYPFAELSLGIAYLLGWQPMVTNLVTLVRRPGYRRRRHGWSS